MTWERHFRGRSALITGGSEGIGLAIARRLSCAGAAVTLVARDPKKLAAASRAIAAEVPGSDCAILPLDVADRDAVAGAIPGIVDARGVDLLVNNAGVSRPGYFWDLPPAEFARIMAVNFDGVVAVTRAALPGLLARRGHVVNVGSVSSVVATLGHSAYCGSKFALYGFSDVLRAELRGRGVRVSIVLPPETETKMLDDERPHLPPGAALLQASAGRLTADAVAVATLRGIARGDFEIVPGLLARATVVASRLAPGLVRAYSDWVVARAAKDEISERPSGIRHRDASEERRGDRRHEPA